MLVFSFGKPTTKHQLVNHHIKAVVTKQQIISRTIRKPKWVYNRLEKVYHHLKAKALLCG